MKELSIEQKAKAYDEAIEKAKMSCHTGDYNKDTLEMLEIIFPELKESEEEKIRKAILDYFTKCWGNCKDNVCGIHVEDAIAWLEKQGEQKHKIQPTFKVGDWITGGYLHCKITDVLDDRYIVDTKFAKRSSIPFKCENNYHLWTIQDAKEGDVLATEPIEGYYSPFVAIYKKQNEEDFDSYCFIGFDGKFCKGENGHSTEEVHPATKEQRDLLSQKMKEARYEWDAEKKELKKIEQSPIEEVNGEDYGIDSLYHAQRILEKTLGSVDGYQSDDGILDHKAAISAVKKLYEQKPVEWSEEDEQHIDSLLKRLDGLCRNEFERTRFAINEDMDWLNSLKDRVQPKQEWNEQEQVKINRIVALLENMNVADNDILLKDVDWLKSLRPQS